MPLHDSTKKDIEKVSIEVLNQSKALDVFPTPVEQIIAHTELVIDKGIDLSKVEKSFFEKLKENASDKLRILQDGLLKVRGLFDRRENTIYVDPNLSYGKQNFIKLHEVGHGILPWQNEIALASDNDKTLLDLFEDEFEAEANYFASITLFQHDRFTKEIGNLPLKLSSSMELAKKFGSSVHAALRNYVIKSPKRCALLVLTPIKSAKGNGAVCSMRNLFYSQSFREEIGELVIPEELGFRWAFVQDFIFNKRYNEKGVITFTTSAGESVNSTYHYFNNTYNIFVFVFPKGEVIKTRTKVEIIKP